MSDRLYIATRKGLFTYENGAADSWNVARTAFIGDPVTMLLDDPRDGTLYAALNLGHFGVKLHRSEDRGESWQEVAVPAYPPEPEEPLDATPAGPSVKQIWSLATAGPDRPGALWAGTLPGGLFYSQDRGDSWVLNQSLWDRPERKAKGGEGSAVREWHQYVRVAGP